MYATRICTIIVILVVERFQPMLCDDQLGFTKEYLELIQEHETHMMAVTLQEGTCYTDKNIHCVTYPGTRANGSEFNVPATDTVYDRKNNQIDFAVIKAGGRQAVDYTALKLVYYNISPVVGKTLREIVNECENKGFYLEGYAWFANVIESTAISAVCDFCELSVKLLDDLERTLIVCGSFKVLLTAIREKFALSDVSYGPILQVEGAVHVMEQPDVDRPKANQFFVAACQEFADRYDNMAGFVKRGGRPFRRVGCSADEAFIALQEIIARETVRFTLP